MTRLFSKLNLTKLFSKLETITIIDPARKVLKKLFTAQCSSLPGIDWREGISQIVKCVGVETPHCGDVEMWWIHIAKMWRYGGSTFKCGGPHIIRIYPRMNVNLHYTDTQYMHLFTFEMWKSTLLHNTSTLLHITSTFKL